MSTFPKKDIVILLPHLGLQSNEVAERLRSFVFCVDPKIVFQSNGCLKIYIDIRQFLPLCDLDFSYYYCEKRRSYEEMESEN